MKKIKITAFLLAFVFIFVTGSYLSSHSTKIASAQSYNILKATVSTGVTVTNTSTKLLDASSGRTYAVIVNDGSVPVYISIGFYSSSP